MTNFEIARMYTGLSAKELARLLEVSPQQLNGWIQGARVPSRTNVEGMAAKMGVDAAWLLGVAQAIDVVDTCDGGLIACEIIHSEAIEGYGMFYVVWLEPVGGWLPVIQCPASGVQFTPRDWQAAYLPRCAGDIGEGEWVDHLGRPAVMLEGLPRIVA